jgi:two-component system chemotaxis response regulator CheB
MAESAAREVQLDGSLPVAELALTLAALTREAPVMAGAGGLAVGAALDDGDGAPTQLTCPDCGGVLHEHTGGGVLRYACHVGHVFAPESLDEAQARQLESALWAAVRTLDDRAALLDRMADRSDGLGHARVAETHRREAADCRRRADLIREVVAQSRPAA